MSISPVSRVISLKPKPYLMAHRGNRVACPENTLAAFRQAVADGADIVETDLHVTRDGEFVCLHDATLERTTTGRGAVAEKTLAELRTLSANYGRPAFANERIPTLAELAQAVPAPTVVALELKTDAFLEPAIARGLAEELSKLGLLRRCLVLSFSRDRLAAFEKVAPGTPIGWITMNAPWPLAGVPLLGPFWPLLLVNPLYVWLAHRRGQIVCPLDPTPDGRLWLYRLLGCDAVLSDDPAATRRALKR